MTYVKLDSTYIPASWQGETMDLNALTFILSNELVEALHLLNQSDDRNTLLEEFLAQIKHVIEEGTGFCIVDGLAELASDLDSHQKIALSLGNLLGTTISQNKNGDHLVMVTDEGKSTKVPTHRGHKTSDELGFHNDRCDLIVLICIHQSEIGGESHLVSCKYVHDYIQTHAPQHLETLYGLFPNHRRGEERAGEHPWCLLPVFSIVAGKPVCRFVKRFILDSQIFDDAPRLTQQQLDALEYMDKVINRDGVKLSFKLKPGQALLINNHTVLHARSKYEDAPGQPKRSLIRVWLSYPESRALPEFFRPLYREVEAGAIRGGI